MARKSSERASQVPVSTESLQASTSRPQTTVTPPTSITTSLLSPATSRALCLVVLAAIYSPLSQSILSPVYGSIPSALYHRWSLTGSALLAFGLRNMFPKWVERGLPAFAFWIPTIHLVVFRFSHLLGNPTGPFIIECLTCYPLITWSMYLAGKLLETLDLSFMGSDALEEAAPAMGCYMLFTFIERTFTQVLPGIVDIGFLTSRVGLQLVIGTLYGLLLPQSLFWPALPSIIATMTLNVHNPLQRTTAVLNNTLGLHHYTLVDRHESYTGYLSVLEDNRKQFRVLRCDHSLLGGQWLDGSPDRKVAEPIYAVFTMMEAVRLVETPKPAKATPDTPKKALNIGLGIGTAPSALITHGINTTIVELDPWVHRFASLYFGLPPNHLYFTGDAGYFVENVAVRTIEDHQYDYILHDVFTGGAVPTSLFTYDFFVALAKLLKPDGTVAINYAGDLNLPSAAMVHRTITSAFPNCRIFREEAEAEQKRRQDFTNLVYFCTHPNNTKPIKFRKPVKADYLGSGARQQFLVPKHELVAADKFNANVPIVRRGDTSQKELNRWQTQSAVGHWYLMRRVIPDVIWENWYNVDWTGHAIRVTQAMALYDEKASDEKKMLKVIG